MYEVRDTIQLEPIHQSGVVLGARILFLQVALAVAGATVASILVSVVSTETSSTFLIIGLAIASIALQTIDAIMIIILVVQWAHTRYIITANEIIVDHGTWQVNRKIYKIDEVASAEVRQSFLGKLFNYGTLVIYSPKIKSDIHLINIPSPHRYLHRLSPSNVD